MLRHGLDSIAAGTGFRIIPMPKGDEARSVRIMLFISIPGFTPRRIPGMKAIKDMDTTPAGKIRVATNNKLLSVNDEER